jgi:long-chain acyl-CoA synthetase
LSDARLGEVPVAAYVAKSGCEAPVEEELKAYLGERLMAYQLPARILCLDELPRTPSLKVSQPTLRALFEKLGATQTGR